MIGGELILGAGHARAEGKYLPDRLGRNPADGRLHEPNTGSDLASLKTRACSKATFTR